MFIKNQKKYVLAWAGLPKNRHPINVYYNVVIECKVQHLSSHSHNCCFKYTAPVRIHHTLNGTLLFHLIFHHSVVASRCHAHSGVISAFCAATKSEGCNLLSRFCSKWLHCIRFIAYINQSANHNSDQILIAFYIEHIIRRSVF